MSELPPLGDVLLYPNDRIEVVTRGESKGHVVWKRIELTAQANGTVRTHLLYSGDEPPPDFKTPPWRGAPLHTA